MKRDRPRLNPFSAFAFGATYGLLIAVLAYELGGKC